MPCLESILASFGPDQGDRVVVIGHQILAPWLWFETSAVLETLSASSRLLTALRQKGKDSEVPVVRKGR